MISPKQHQTGIFIHRRDLRVQDNTALNRALEECEQVLACFIFDPVQIGDGNEYRSDRQVHFMKESLRDLAGQYEKIGGKLHLLQGKPSEVVAQLIQTHGANAVYTNADYTPYSKQRDAEIEEACVSAGVTWNALHDLLLCGDPAGVLTGAGKPFTVFTPFWRRASEKPVHKPVAVKKGTFFMSDVGTAAFRASLPEKVVDDSLGETPGREAAREILADLKYQRGYAAQHNDPNLRTSRLSAHMKFGTVSIRETFHAMERDLGMGSPLVRQLYWRDFYTSIVYHFPHVVGKSFDLKNEILYWNESEEDFAAWKEGRTGFPIVDAGMREMNATGYMHNRLRLITGSFITKDLHMPWWMGEKYFAQKLVDYDLSLNNGNWQWVGGTGTDPVPYFRIFNPWLQAKKFDPQAAYIKKWVPELAELSAAQIHGLPVKPLPEGIDYPKPMLDHAEELKKVKALYKKEA